MADKSANEVGVQRISISQCRRFSQNAWKKDLCSNCFKSKDEHKKPETVSRPTHQIVTPNSDLKPKQSILKSVSSRVKEINSANGSNTNGSLSSNKTDIGTGNCNGKSGSGSSLRVNFPAEESEVIGYGGDDDFGSSDDSCEEDHDDINDNNECDETLYDDDESEMQRITKLNTDFNSITANLVVDVPENSDTSKSISDKKRLHIPLLLGRPNTGSDGQKQTLLVSVKPFGSDSEPNKLVTKQIIKNDTTVVNSSDCKSLNKVNFTNSKISEHNDKSVSDKSKIVTKIEKNDRENDSKCLNGLNEQTTDSVKDINTNNNETLDKKVNGTVLNEIRKTQITRGNVITKNHEQVKTKLFQSSGVINDLKSESIIVNDQNKNVNNENQNEHDVNSDIKLVYLIVDNENDDGIVNNDEDKVVKKDDLLTKNEFNVNNVDVDRKIFTANKLEIEAPNKVSQNLVIANHNVTRIQQKNYKNSLSSDDNIKSATFKDNITNIGCDFYGINGKPASNINEHAIVDQSLMGIDDDTNTLPSRELAGEPDGSADSNDVHESAISSAAVTAQPVVSLLRSPPSTPPPPPPPQISPTGSDVVHPPRSSFLHSLQSTKINNQPGINVRLSPDKPKLPSKPSSLSLDSANVEQEKILTVSDEDAAATCDDAESILSNQQTVLKRQAPKPPSTPTPVEQPQLPAVANVARSPTVEIPNGGLFMRKASANSIDFDTPVTKTRDKRIYQTPTNCGNNIVADFAKSMSHDSTFGALLTSASATATVTKRGSKVRSTLRKLLRFGSRDDDMFDDSSSGVILTTHGNSPANSGPSTHRVRPEIIHPLDLNKSGVQVLRNVTDHEQIYSNCITKMDDDLGLTQTGINNKQRPVSHYGVLPGSGQSHSHYTVSNTGRPNKPPPPPRCQSLDLTSSPMRGPAPPARPPPPISTFSKSASSHTSFGNSNNVSNNMAPDNFVYVNLGDKANRPVKPTRSGTNRDLGTGIIQSSAESNGIDDGNVYETIMVSRPNSVISDSNGVYGQYTRNGKSENTHKNGVDAKTNSQSELKELKTMSSVHNQSNNCTVIHNTVEDNYKALVSSNHEALSRFLQQENGKFYMGSQCSLVRSSDSLCWTDFKLDDSVQPTEIGSKVFYAAHYRGQVHEAVTLCVLPKCEVTVEKCPNQLQVLAEFVDFIPKQYVYRNKSAISAGISSNVVQVNVAVMIRQTVESFNSHIWSTRDVSPGRGVSTFGDTADKHNSNNILMQTEESILVLFQLIDCLLLLQTHGFNNLYRSDLVLCKYQNGVRHTKTSEESSLHVCIFPHQRSNEANENEHINCNGITGNNSDDKKVDYVSLNQCITDALHAMPVSSEMSAHLQRLLKNNTEKTDLLLKMKAMVGLWLWGPPNDVISCSTADKQKIIQHWLDLERAKVLQNLLMSYHSPQLLNVYDWSYASFLVQMNANIIIDTLTSIGDYNSFLGGAFRIR